MEETITISREEYELLKKNSDIDTDLLIKLIKSLKDIKNNDVIRVK